MKPNLYNYGINKTHLHINEANLHVNQGVRVMRGH